MKIKRISSDKEIKVYAIYWLDGEIYFYGHAYGYNGLLAYKEREVIIIDPNLTEQFIFFENGIFFKPLIEENILYKLLEADDETYERFMSIINCSDQSSKNA